MIQTYIPSIQYAFHSIVNSIQIQFNQSIPSAADLTWPIWDGSTTKNAMNSPIRPMHYENAKEAVQAGLYQYQLLIQHHRRWLHGGDRPQGQKVVGATPPQEFY